MQGQNVLLRGGVGGQFPVNSIMIPMGDLDNPESDIHPGTITLVISGT